MRRSVWAIALLALGWLAWPYYAVYDLVQSVQNGDVIALDHRIDWTSVRDGLREDLKAAFVQKMAAEASRGDKSSSALGAGLAALIGPKIIDTAVDSYVTPQGIAALIKSGKPQVQPPANSVVTKSSDARAVTVANAPVPERHFDFDRVRYAFFTQDPLTFRIDVSPPPDSTVKEDTTLLLRWSGTWRLTRIFLPADVLR